MCFLGWGVGSLPALGPLLAVSGGIWDHQRVELSDQKLPGLRQPVTVIWDQNRVPHFFAEEESDLYRAQGFVMASQRLFQMDVLTRVTAGRLSELFGEKTVARDRFFIKFGMRESARRTLARYQSDERSRSAMKAFVEGVNAFITSRNYWGPEYKILGVKPELFDELRIIHMAKQLTFNLAGRSYDTYLSKIKQDIGVEPVLDLFPLFDPADLGDYIVSSDSKNQVHVESAGDFPFVTRLQNVPYFPLPGAGQGSNNWAVSAKKSANGFSIFANDTHLSLTLPNIWFESQLVIPEFNVYGASLVAIPGLINGFNPFIAWGPTNGTTDVFDFYEMEFESASSNRYRNGEEWLEAEVQSEVLKIRGGREETLEVVWTKKGPLLHRENELALAGAWIGHQPDQELRAVRGLYQAKSIDECLESFKSWAVPIQNFICADAKDVAIQHTGFIPKRSRGQGRFIMDGRSDEIPFPASAERPKVVRPESGFVLSANQKVVGPGHPLYLGWDFEPPFRGMRIRELLMKKEKHSPESFIEIQNDIFNTVAKLTLPLMLAALDPDSLNEQQREIIDELRSWDYQDRALDRAPAVFWAWYGRLKAAIFGDEYQLPAREFFPRDPRVIALLRNISQDPNHRDSVWVDDKLTPQKESVKEMVARAFQEGWSRLEEKQGKDPKQWSFKDWIQTRLQHIAFFPGFGSEVLPMDGGYQGLRGNKGRHGAVYKIVVQLGEWPEAWIQIPGGSTGDPFDPDYERHVGDWVEGRMRKAFYFKNIEEGKEQAAKVVVFSP